MILAGDVGGTKSNLALVEQGERGFTIAFKKRYASADYSCFEDIIASFLRDAAQVAPSVSSGKIIAVGFGVAGPVVDDRVALTNLTWSVDGATVRRQMKTDAVVLLNDLEATGSALSWLPTRDLYVLNAGKAAPRAARCLIAAGTGLGEAILRPDGDHHRVEPGEGGHCDLAPRTEKEIELLRYMKRSDRYVSFELVLSGRGFFTLHQFLNAGVRHPSFEQPGVDPAPEITQLGLAGSCSVCVETLDLWTALYGAEAGNLALKALALGGVFVAGGIVTKILPKVKDGTFFRAFCEKEKFGEILAQIPISVVLNEDAPLIGAAAEAARRSQG